MFLLELLRLHFDFWGEYPFIRFTALFIFLISILNFYYFKSKRNYLPPGPFCLPIVGYLPFIGDRPHLTFKSLQEKYGNVVSLYFGSRYVIVLCDYLAVREAFMKNAFLGRPPNAPNHVIKETVSFSVCSGYVWKEQRRFALHVFRNLGFGKHKMEDYIKEEIVFFLNTLQEYKGEPCNVRQYLSPSTSNNISALMFGRRMDYDDPKRILLNKVVDDLLRFFRPTGYHAFFPRLRSLLFRYEILGYKDVNVTIREMLNFVDDEIKYHQKTFDADNVRDYLDSYLLEMEKRKEKRDNSFTISMLRGNIPSLFGAGGSTVRTTIEWALLTMAAYPDVQKRIQAEIDDVIGHERTPFWMDHSSMPFTESVLMEIQRWKTVVPVNLVRYGLEDETVQGYYIPKGTIVFANLWEVHHDPRYWENPDDFIPERFLSEDKASVNKHPCYMPFTIGKRACPGESLAVMEVFLYFTSILQKFEVFPPNGTTVNFDASLGVIYEPLPYKLRLVLRNE